MLLWCGYALPAEHWRAVEGAALQRLFADREFADGAHFAYQFNASGSFAGTELGKEVRGSWRVKGNELCWNWQRPVAPEECYRVEQDGASVRMMLNGSEAWSGTLQKIR